MTVTLCRYISAMGLIIVNGWGLSMSDNNDDNIAVREKANSDVFDFIIKKAAEPEYKSNFIDNHPVDQTLGLKKRKEELLKQKREWTEYCKKLKKQEDPIERYCYDIRSEVPDYEISFEEHLREEQEVANIRQLNTQKFLEYIDTRQFFRMKPEGMTDKQWVKEKRKKKRFEREERKESEYNGRLE
jgi:hypothetical protein